MAEQGAAQRSSGEAGSGASGGAAQRDGASYDTADVLAEALRRADEAYIAERNNITEGRDCQAFYANANGVGQWDPADLAKRQKAGRPVLTVNMLPSFAKQVSNDIRKNPPSIKVLPAGGGATKDTAEGYDGIIRNIEQQSGAEDIYIKAADNMVQAGQGFITIATEYSDTDVFGEDDGTAKKGKAKTKTDIREQDIRIHAVLDPFGCLLDPFPQLIDKSDIRYGFVFETWSLEEFKLKYPDISPVDFPRTDGDGAFTGFPWRTGNAVTIAAYWRRVPIKKTIYQLPDGSVTDDEKRVIPQPLQAQFPDLTVEKVIADGHVKTRQVDSFKVEMWRMTGNALLDDAPHPFPGKLIPIVMVPGEEITKNGVTIRKGMVHDARDAQRIYNYTRSASMEAIAMQPRSAWVLTADQVKGRERMWATSGSDNHAYLVYNADPKAQGAPQRGQPAIASEGMDKQSLIAAEDVKRITGIHDASLGAQSNETSGVAIQARQHEGDTATFMFPFNLSRALRVVGKILVGIIPEVYDNERQLRILKPDGTASMVTVNGQPQQNPKTGKPAHPVYDLSDGKYDVVVSTGPTFATQRAEAVTGMIEMIRADPKLMGVAGDLLVGAMDWPMADELAKRLRKANGIPEDGEPPPPPPPPPPDVIASAKKDAATAEKTLAEADGQKIENATAAVNLEMTLSQIGQALPQILAFMQAAQGGMPLQGGAPPGAPGAPPGGPGVQPPGPPGMPPPGAPPLPPPPPALPPMMHAPEELPPMTPAPEQKPSRMVPTKRGRVMVTPQ